MVARLWYGLSVALCVFDLDHTLIQTPLDLAAMAVDMRALIEAASGPLPARHERYRVGELIAYCRSQAPALESAAWDLALDHERRAMEVATLESGALAALGGAAAAAGVPFIAYRARQADLDRWKVTPIAQLADLALLPAWLEARGNGRP